jgi:hypothetical protein
MTTKKKKKIKNCLDCSCHEIIDDRDPHDSFCSDDIAVVCTITQNPNCKPKSKYLASRSKFHIVACACRPYNAKKEATVPDWCPKNK